MENTVVAAPAQPWQDTRSSCGNPTPPLLTSLDRSRERLPPLTPRKSLDVRTDWPILGLRRNPKSGAMAREMECADWLSLDHRSHPQNSREALSLDCVKRFGRREVVMGGEQATATHFIYVSVMSFSLHLYSFI